MINIPGEEIFQEKKTSRKRNIPGENISSRKRTL